MWIVPWDPFLMKKLLKSEICGSMNSARCALIGWKKARKVKFCSYCSCTVHEQQPQVSQTREKKKKKQKNANANANVVPKHSHIQKASLCRKSTRQTKNYKEKKKKQKKKTKKKINYKRGENKGTKRESH